MDNQHNIEDNHSITQEIIQDDNNESEPLVQNLTLTKDIQKKPEIIRSGSHRAGFDAFMTGFILSTYIAQYGSYSNDSCNLSFSDLGIDYMKNSVYLTGKDHPLNVVKSSFSKVSKEHREKFVKLKVGRPISS